MKFVNSLEIGIRFINTKLHKTLSFDGEMYIKEKYTKLFNEILCKTNKFTGFFDFTIKPYYSLNFIDLFKQK